MARFTGAGDFVTVIKMGVESGRMVLMTDEGPLRLSDVKDAGEGFVTGITEDKRLVTIDIYKPDQINIT